MAEPNNEGSANGKTNADYESLGYREKDVVSSLIKSMRLGNVEDSFYWFQVMQEAGESYYRLALTLITFAYEDCYEDAVIMVSDACWRSMMAQKQRGMSGNTPFWWIERLCRARKFWECEEGRERERIWWKVVDEIKNKGATRPIPPYACDGHSYTGWKMKREGKEFDERFSGTRWGRVNMCAMAERDGGKLDPDAEPVLKRRSLDDWKPAIVPLDAKSGIYLVESQNEAGLKYQVNVVEGTCQCPHYKNRGPVFCKHLQKATRLHEQLEKERQERAAKNVKKGGDDLPF